MAKKVDKNTGDEENKIPEEPILQLNEPNTSKPVEMVD